MIRFPCIGQVVRIRYGKKYISDVKPGLHNYGGTITAVGKGKGPKNVAVNLWDGSTVVVPKGNLFDWNHKFKMDKSV